MSHVTLAPYLQTEEDGSDPRITFPVTTPAALVMVESRARGRFTVRGANPDGVRIAIAVARDYVRSHPIALGRLYAQIEVP